MDYNNFFRKIKIITIVGLSDKPERYSYQVGKYLIDQGFKIIPVNPNITEVFNLKSYPDLVSINQLIDTVVIFRRSEFVGPIIDEAIKTGVKTVWMQEGVIDEQAAVKARATGLTVVMDKCIMKEHRKILDGKG